MKKFLVCFLSVILALSLFSCTATNDSSKESESVKNSESASASESVSESTETFTAPVITVEPAQVEITVGDDIDLMLGVSVTDKYDTGLAATVSDDQDFDKTVAGTYTITYSVTNSKGKTGTAQRTVVVKKAPARIGVEVTVNNGDVWATNNGLTMWFTQDQFYTVTENKDYTIADDPATTDVDESKKSPIMSGIFYNDSDAEVTINFAGTHGEVAVINTNGIVVYGIDGSNGRYVTAAYPDRLNAPSNSSATQIGKDLKIPSKNYAVVVQNTGNFDEDGRSFIGKNVIGYYGTQIMIKMEDGSKNFTSFVDQAPFVKGNTSTLKVVKGDTTFTENLKAKLLDGVTISDDNGTFEASDNVVVSADNVTVEENTSFDINTVGTYTFKLKVKDAENNEREFTRNVEIYFIPVSNYLCYTSNNVQYYLTDYSVIYNTNYSVNATTQWIAVYDKTFTGKYNAGWSVYAIVDKDTGVISEMGDWSKIYDAENPAGKTQTVAADVASGVVARLTDSQLLIIFANNGNNIPGGARTYGANIIKLLTGTTALNTIKLTINIDTESVKLSVQPAEVKFVNGTLATSWQPTEIAINTDYKSTVGRINIFDMTYTGTYKAGFSVYAIVEADGTVSEIGDWSKIYNAANPNGTATGVNGSDVASGVVARLTEGEHLVIFANDGANAAGNGRWFGQQLENACKGTDFKTIKLQILNIFPAV